MAYTPINWQTGDTITAAGLNKMDNGWGVESSLLCEETITTEPDLDYPDDPAWGAFTYSTQITADSITVTFDGTDYVCPKIDADGDIFYGGFDDGFDFTNYPFAIGSYGGLDGNMLATASGGTHTVKIVVPSIEASDNFSTAVNTCVDTSMMPLLCISGVTTVSELVEATGKRIKYFFPYQNYGDTVKIIIGYDATDGYQFIPADTTIKAKIVNGVFTVTYN